MAHLRGLRQRALFSFLDWQYIMKLVSIFLVSVLLRELYRNLKVNQQKTSWNANLEVKFILGFRKKQRWGKIYWEPLKCSCHHCVNEWIDLFLGDRYISIMWSKFTPDVHSGTFINSLWLWSRGRCSLNGRWKKLDRIQNLFHQLWNNCRKRFKQLQLFSERNTTLVWTAKLDRPVQQMKGITSRAVRKTIHWEPILTDFHFYRIRQRLNLRRTKRWGLFNQPVASAPNLCCHKLFITLHSAYFT